MMRMQTWWAAEPAAAAESAGQLEADEDAESALAVRAAWPGAVPRRDAAPAVQRVLPLLV